MTFNSIIKLVQILTIAIIFSSCGVSNLTVKVKPNQQVVIDYPDYALYQVKVRNYSLKKAEIRVENKATNQRVRSFGLGGWGTEEVNVERENQLVLKNSNSRKLRLKLGITEKVKPIVTILKTVAFTLENTSDEKILLQIPTVMNPSLSPNSKSGVELKIGQQILFRKKGKQHVLLTVDDSIQPNAVINVVELLKARKKKLGLED